MQRNDGVKRIPLRDSTERSLESKKVTRNTEHTPRVYGRRTEKSRALLFLERSMSNAITQEEERCARLRAEKKSLEARVVCIDDELSRLYAELNEKMDTFLRLHTSD